MEERLILSALLKGHMNDTCFHQMMKKLSHSCYFFGVFFFKALVVSTQLTNHVSDKGFCCRTFYKMLTWEAATMMSKPLLKVDIENYVGPEAFE